MSRGGSSKGMSPLVVCLVVVLTVIVVLAGLNYWVLGGAMHAVLAWLAGAWPALAVLGAGLGVAVLFTASEHYGSTIAVTIVAVSGMVLVFWVGSYASDRGLYYASQPKWTEDAGSLSYEPRTAMTVAEATSDRNLGNTSGNRSSSARALPGRDSWTATIDKRGFGKGYESIQQMKLPLYGEASSKDVQFCSFSDDAKLKLDGSALLGTSLKQAVANKTSLTTRFHSGDARFYCDGASPKLVIPLVKKSGLWFPHDEPAGVAVYDGKTGSLEIRDSVDVDGVPTYPQSAAAAQRESIKASGSFADWVFGRAGYEGTESDKNDPNSENRSEITLARKGRKRTDFVTPLTPRGSSSSIVAVATVQADGKGATGLKPLEVHKFKDGAVRQANSAVEQTITTLMTRTFNASQDLQLFEIIPSEDGTWTASIGKNQSIVYRAVIKLDGAISLKDSTGAVVASNAEDEDGETDGSKQQGTVTGGNGSTGSTGLSKPSKPLDQMTTAELKQWSGELSSELQSVISELASRAK